MFVSTGKRIVETLRDLNKNQVWFGSSLECFLWKQPTRRLDTNFVFRYTFSSSSLHFTKQLHRTIASCTGCDYLSNILFKKSYRAASLNVYTYEDRSITT